MTEKKTGCMKQNAKKIIAKKCVCFS